MATLGMWSSRVNSMNKSMPSCCLPSACFSLNHRAPLVHRCVQGGNATTISQVYQGFNALCTSSWICHSGCLPLHGKMSQLYASWPRALNALQTSCDSSHAHNIFISPHPCHFLVCQAVYTPFYPAVSKWAFHCKILLWRIFMLYSALSCLITRFTHAALWVKVD